MPTRPSPTRPLRSFPSTRRRDDFICWVLNHPATATTIMAINLFALTRKLRACLQRLADEGRIQLVGTIQLGRGRPENVYCRWQPDPAYLVREVQLTEIFLRLHAGDVRRGPFVTDHTICPDAEVQINADRYSLELDRGTADVRPIAQRLCTYDISSPPSLWLCTTQERAEALRTQADTLPGTKLIATLAEARAGAHRDIWRDRGGRRVTLPEEREDEPAAESHGTKDGEGAASLTVRAVNDQRGP